MKTVGKRRKAREIVLQALYEAEFSDQPSQEILAGQVDRRCREHRTAGRVEEPVSILAKILRRRIW